MRAVSVSEAKNRLSALLEWVKAGEEVLILDRGVPVARLSPVGQEREEGLLLLERKGLVRRGQGQAADLEALPWPKAQGDTLRALLAEREEGR